MHLKSLVVLIPLALSVLSANAAFADEVPELETAVCNASANRLPLLEPGSAAETKFLNNLAITLHRTSDYRMPFGEAIHRWRGHETFDLGDGYSLFLWLEYMPQSPVGDFVSSRPTLALFAREIRAPSADASRVISTGAASAIEGGEGTQNPAVSLNLIDTELDDYLHGHQLQEDSVGDLVRGDYWAAIRDFVAAQHPEVPRESWNEFVNFFWPEVQAFLAPLHRDTFYPFVAVRCTLQ